MNETSKLPRSGSAAAWRRSAAKLLDLQLWLFGYDIRRPEGNLLVEFGCARIAAPAGNDCSSCYQADLITGERLTLRGFGVLCDNRADSRAIFLHRDLFAVSEYGTGASELPWRPGEVQSAGGLSAEAREYAAVLVRCIARWIAAYEDQVADRLGSSYRQLAIEERGKAVSTDPAELANCWRQIASDLERRAELIGSSKRHRQTKRRRAPRPLVSSS